MHKLLSAKVSHLAKWKLRNLFRRKLLPIQIIQRWPLKKSRNDKRGIILKRKWSSSDQWWFDRGKVGCRHKTLLVYYRDLWTCMHALYDRGDFISVCCKSSALAYISRLFDGNISLSILIWFITYKVLAPSWTVSYFALSQVKVV